MTQVLNAGLNKMKRQDARIERSLNKGFESVARRGFWTEMMGGEAPQEVVGGLHKDRTRV